MKKVALAYSGGLDTSVMIPWLRENYGCEVVAVVADVGQREDFDTVAAKAYATGASDCRVIDLRDAFARECIVPALRAGAVYERRYLLGTALARPVIARAQVQVALDAGCDALAHGCTGKGNDQVRFELTYRALAPHLTVIAPWREWELHSRDDAFDYAEARGIPVPGSRAKPYSIDRNLWHTSFEGGILEDPEAAAPSDLRDLTVDPVDAPDAPRDVVIGFEKGVPVSLDGRALAPATLIEHLNDIAGAHGVGQVDLVENRLVGMKSRGVYETPAGTVLLTALTDLESITLDRDTVSFKRGVGARYAELVYQGLWYSPLREALDAFLDSAHATVTGEVTVRLFRGCASAVSRSSPYSLYREDLATFDEDAVYDHADAGGFIHLWGLPSGIAHRVRRQAEAAAAQRDTAEAQREAAEAQPEATETPTETAETHPETGTAPADEIGPPTEPAPGIAGGPAGRPAPNRPASPYRG